MSVLAVKVELAEAWKADGGAAFKNKDYRRATAAYKQALAVLNCPDGCELAADEYESIRRLLAVLHVNLAACCLQEKTSFAANECEKHCTEALRHDESNVKAWFRRYQAHVRSGDLEKAKHDIHHAVEREPTNPTLRKELARVLELLAAQTSAQKKLYSRAF
ncbi:hypothetical protein ACHHYP_13766 [Achlya hypogyna]|uniref:peptidylprolyl isomerase n=1 Tax=Achlya hypogyna TaxID=1202772 RepID=A0A1V9ZFF5_ACHHY|nr:hypothetical protein ACHHYP_13766 [Achlya hypogyna]